MEKQKTLGDLLELQRKKEEAKHLESMLECEKKIDELSDWLLDNEYHTEEWQRKLHQLEKAEKELDKLKYVQV
jgi:hypothetical protein